MIYFDAETTACITAEDELEALELGDRPGWYFLMWDMIKIYSHQKDRERSAVLELVGEVASVTSHKGLPYPAYWWPTEAGYLADPLKGMFN